jgi:hypothetical protein
MTRVWASRAYSNIVPFSNLWFGSTFEKVEDKKKVSEKNVVKKKN